VSRRRPLLGTGRRYRNPVKELDEIPAQIFLDGALLICCTLACRPIVALGSMRCDISIGGSLDSSRWAVLITKTGNALSVGGWKPHPSGVVGSYRADGSLSILTALIRPMALDALRFVSPVALSLAEVSDQDLCLESRCPASRLPASS
jgi:hypothetical protein